jgi:hypothetical protein
MAMMYQQGYSVPKDGMKALELLELSAAQNYPDAQFEKEVYFCQEVFETKILKRHLY